MKGRVNMKMRVGACFIVNVIVIFLAINVLAADILVSTPVTAESINNAISTAKPGDAVIIPDGTYSNLNQINIPINVDGTKDSPITLKAQTQGGVIFSGKVMDSCFMRISSDYWIIRDFKFLDLSKIGDANTYGILVDANYVRITNNYFEGIGNRSTRTYSWAIWMAKDADAYYCRIDNNTMTGSKAKFVHNSTDAHASTAKYTIIDHNYLTNPTFDAKSFLHLGTGGAVENESIDSFITVEYNIFENHDAGGEPIDDKSSSNTIRYNVFISKGDRIQDAGVVLRGGDDTLVERNFFFNVGGQNIRVHGTGHMIKHNYFENPGYSAILIAEGGPNYAKVTDIHIENNTIVNPISRGIHIGWWPSGDIKPANLTFKKNMVVSSVGNLVRDQGHTGYFIWEDNLHYARESAAYWINAGGVDEPSSGIIKVDPDSPQGTQIAAAYGSDIAYTDPISKSEVGVSWLREILAKPGVLLRAPSNFMIVSTNIDNN